MEREANEPSERLALSALNALEYCPRRFYYECVRSEFLENHHTLEGTFKHERSDSGQASTEHGLVTMRRVWLWSERLQLSGFADVVEEEGQQLTPIEYKKGKMGEWLNDHVQLCAQALCLEEMLTCTVSRGYIFYFGSGHREEVIFSDTLRQHTEASIHQAQALFDQSEPPAPLIGRITKRNPLPSLHPKCRDCSLEPLCLPREVLFMQMQKEKEKGRVDGDPLSE